MNPREYEIMFAREDAYWWYRGMRRIARHEPLTGPRRLYARAVPKTNGTLSASRLPLSE